MRSSENRSARRSCPGADELDDLGTHANSSHTRDCDQADQRERYQICGHRRLSREMKSCGMIAGEAQSFRARTLSLLRGRLRRWPATPHAGTFARAGKSFSRRFGRRRACDAPGDGHWEMWRRDVRPPSDSGNSQTKKPAADFSARALHDFCDDDVMPVICPTCQTFCKSQNEAQRIRPDSLNKMKCCSRALILR